MLQRLHQVAGFEDFVASIGPLAMLASTPGWEDADANKTTPGAKPIGLAQWGAAIAAAGLMVEAESRAGWPIPGIDPAGFIWLTWRIADNAELALELHADILAQTYKWTAMRDGIRVPYKSYDPREVIASLRSVLVGAQRAA
jgi:hypothetical protein